MSLGLQSESSLPAGLPVGGIDAGGREAVARALLTGLERDCSAFCILSGYDRLPQEFDSDIDFMVLPREFRRVPRLVGEVAAETGVCLFLTTPHEISARAFFLAGQQGTALTFVQPDATADYRHYGRLWLRAEEVLRSRRWHPNGFWIPGAAYEFIYYLIKRVNKRDFGPRHGDRLSRLYAEDAAGADALLRRYWKEGTVRALRAMAASNSWAPLMRDVEIFRRELWEDAPVSGIQRLVSRVREFLHDVGRVLRPTGAMISFMGPDGCGKSSVIEAVAEAFRPAFRDVRRFHLRPKLLKARTAEGAAVPDPHGKRPYSALSSMVRAVYMAADYIGGYFLRVRPALMRSSLVFFDRYAYDLLVDPRRVRYGGPRWWLRLMARVAPEPDLVLLLNAAPEVLWARKQEIAPDELARQQQAYLAVARQLRSAVVIDAAQPLDQVVHDVQRVILSHLAARTRKRLHLSSAMPPRSARERSTELPVETQ